MPAVATLLRPTSPLSHTQINGTHALALCHWSCCHTMPCNVITQTTPLTSSILMAPWVYTVYPFSADNNNNNDKMLNSMWKWNSGFTHPPLQPSFCTQHHLLLEMNFHELLIRGKIVITSMVTSRGFFSHSLTKLKCRIFFIRFFHAGDSAVRVF